jgi:hypothetical protein
MDKLLKAKALFDESKSQQVGLWWDSVRFFSTWNNDCRNKQWSELPDWAKHELIGIYDSLPMPVCQH